MKKMVFIGNKENGYFAEEVAKSNGYQYQQMEAPGNIRHITNEILMLSHNTPVEILIYDVDAFINDAEEIAKEIAQTARAISAIPIIYMPSFIPESVMTQALYAEDLKRFIFSGTATSLKEQLIKNITGYYDANGRKELEKVQERQAAAEAHIESFQTIGIAGTQSRVGTTTQALQIVKYLQAKGYSACYIEMNQKRYFDLTLKSGTERERTYVEKYITLTDSNLAGKAIFKNVDMYIGNEALNVAKNQNYDYYVYDYGSILDRDFDRTAFVKDDTRIMVAGGKPAEFDYLQQFLAIPLFADCSLILSFVPEDVKADVLKTIVGIKLPGNATNENRLAVFADYTPNPFSVPDLDLYQKIVPVEMTEKMKEVLQEIAAEDAEKEKKRFFKRKGKKK